MRSLRIILVALGVMLPGCRDAARTEPLAPEGTAASELDLATESSDAVLRYAGPVSSRDAGTKSPPSYPKALVDPPSIGLPSIIGQVIDVRTGRGKPGLVVWLNLGNGHSQQTTTGPDGTFRMEPAWEFKKAVAIVRAGPDWRVLSGGSRLSEAEARGKEELRIEVAEIREAPVSGIALDAATGEPIPELRFSLSRGSGTRWPKGLVAQSVETGPDGGFTTEGNIRGGMLAISTLDGGPRPQLGKVQCVLGTPKSSPLKLYFLAAPTIEIELIGRTPADPTTLSASLQVKRGDAMPGDTSTVPHPGYPFYRTTVRRRTDGTLWIRPPLPRIRPQPDVPLELVLRSPDGMLEGRTPVEYRRYDEPLEVTMVGTGTISFSVKLEPLDFPSPMFERQNPRLELTAADASGAVLAAEYGRYSGLWKQLAPGPYVVRAWSRTHELVATPIRVEVGKEQQVRFDLGRLEETRTVRGSLLIERKGSPRAFDLEIGLEGPVPRIWRVHHTTSAWVCGTGMDYSLRASEDDRSGTFEIEGVPHGQLTARIDDPDRLFDIGISGEPDGDQFIRLREFSLASGLGFRVSQGEEPDEDQHYQVRTRPLDGGPPLDMRVANGEPVLEGVPGERRFEWILWSYSAGPVLGTHEDFIETAPGVFFADVNLPPHGAWTPLLTVEDEAGQAVVDAVVLLDGKPAELGPRGELPLSEADKAGTFHDLEVRAPGFHPLQRIQWPLLSREPQLTVTLDRL